MVHDDGGFDLSDGVDEEEFDLSDEVDENGFDLSDEVDENGFDLSDDAEVDEDEEDDLDDVETVEAKRVTSRFGGRTAKILALVAGVVVLVAVGFFLVEKPNDGPKVNPSAIAGSILMKEYEEVELGKQDLGGGKSISDFRSRHEKALEWIKAGNITSSSKKLVTIQVTGKRGTVVKFKIMLHAIRVGNDESWLMIPLDGPYSLAACKLLDLDLPTKWMAEQLRIKAFEGGGKVQFIAEPEILGNLGERSTAHERDWSLKGLGRRKGPSEMQTPRMIRSRGELFMALLKKEEIDSSKPVSGHFKEVIQDPKQAERKKLATYRACGGEKPAKNWRKDEWLGCTFLADKHPPGYFDYSHGVRCAKSKMQVGKRPKPGDDVDYETMTIVEFYASSEYRKEFDLPSKLDEPPYEYLPQLKKWMEENN